MDLRTRTSGHHHRRARRQLPKIALLYCTEKQSIVGATTLLSCRSPQTSLPIEWTVTHGVELTTHMEISKSMKRYEAPFFNLTAQSELEVRCVEVKSGGTLNDHVRCREALLVMRLDWAHIDPLLSSGT